MIPLPHIPFCLYSSVNDNRDEHGEIVDVYYINFCVSRINMNAEHMFKDKLSLQRGERT